MAGRSVALPPIPDGYELETPQSTLPPIPDGYELEGAPAKDPSYLQSLGKGTGDAVIGVANTVDKFLPDGGKNNDYYLNNIHQLAKNAIGWTNAEKKQFGVDDASYGPSQSSQVQLMHPSTWSHVPGALLESAPGLVASAGAGAVAGPAGFIGTQAAINAGNTLDQRVANQGGAPATGSDKAIAAGSALTQAALARFGLGKLNAGSGLGSSFLQKAATDLGGAAVANAGVGAAGNVVDQLGRTVGTKAGTNVDPTEVGNAGLMGAATGLGAKALTTPGDFLNSRRFEQFGGPNAQAAADVAQTLNSPGYSTEDVGGAAKAVRGAKSIYSSRANAALGTGDVQGAISNGDPGLAQSVPETLAKLKDGTALPEEHLADLEAKLGPNGVALTHNMRAMNVVNNLNKMGYWGGSEKNPTFAGGLSNSPVGNFLNPLSFITSPGSHGAASNLLLAALGAHELGIPIPHLGTGMAIAAATRPILKAGDWMTGKLNPANEFATRFAPKGQFTPPAPPGAPPAFAGSMGGGNPGGPGPQGMPGPAPGGPPSFVPPGFGGGPKPAAPPPPAFAGSQGPTSGPSGYSSQAIAPNLGPPSFIPPGYGGGPAARPGPAWTPEMVRDASADNRAFNTQETSAANAQNKAYDLAQRAAAAKAAMAAQKAPQAPREGLVVNPDGTGGTFNPDAKAGVNVNPDTVTISHGPYTVSRPTENIQNLPAYISATKRAMSARADLGNTLTGLAPNKAPEIQGFVDRMNNQSKSFQDAAGHFEDLVNDHIPEKASKAAFDAWNAHEAKIRGTYKQ